MLNEGFLICSLGYGLAALKAETGKEGYIVYVLRAKKRRRCYI